MKGQSHCKEGQKVSDLYYAVRNHWRVRRWPESSHSLVCNTWMRSRVRQWPKRPDLKEVTSCWPSTDKTYDTWLTKWLCNWSDSRATEWRWLWPHLSVVTSCPPHRTTNSSNPFLKTQTNPRIKIRQSVPTNCPHLCPHLMPWTHWMTHKCISSQHCLEIHPAIQPAIWILHRGPLPEAEHHLSRQNVIRPLPYQ